MRNFYAIVCAMLFSASFVGKSHCKVVNKNVSEEKKDFLGVIVDVLADSDLINKEDLKLYRRTGRDNPLSDLAFGVFKELVSEFLTSTMGSFFGVETERTSSGEDFNIISMIMNAVNKNTMQKKMGC